MDGVSYLGLGAHTDERGKLVFAEHGNNLPFAMERMYFMTDVPPNAVRAGVMHRELEQVFVAVKGHFDVTVDDGLLREDSRRTFRVDSPVRALYVPPLLWREVGHFSPDAICLVLVSHGHDPAEQEKDYGTFLAQAAGQQ